MISESTELHTYCVQRLCAALNADISQQPLCKVALWTIGEYGDLILSSQAHEGVEFKEVGVTYVRTYVHTYIHTYIQVTEDEVLDVVERVLQSPQSSLTTKEYAINAAMKLSTR